MILIGDPDQLKPIGPGDAFRGLLEQHWPAPIETIRRQAEPWQREASEHLAGGRVATALDAYHDAGRLHVADRAMFTAAYREASYEVRGGALAGKAAENLQREAFRLTF